VRAPGLRCRGL